MRERVGPRVRKGISVCSVSACCQPGVIKPAVCVFYLLMVDVVMCWWMLLMMMLMMTALHCHSCILRCIPDTREIHAMAEVFLSTTWRSLLGSTRVRTSTFCLAEKSDSELNLLFVPLYTSCLSYAPS